VTAQLIDGKKISAEIQQEIAARVRAFTQQRGITPCLAAVLVGENPASEVYVRNKRKACERAGIDSQLHRLAANVSEDELLALVARLNEDAAVSGILVQLPLPQQIRETRVLDAVHPAKDVDCFHPENVGRLSQGRPRFLPCTPHGVQQVLHRSGLPIAGKEVVIVGRSEIVGKPLAMLLMAKDSTCGPTAANATVTIAHSRTANLAEVTRRADVLVAAIGQPKFITAAMIKPGAVVIDVGINRTDDGLCGDVDFTPALEVASAITPVPGGVGPLTIAMLLMNTLTAAEALVARRAGEGR
jgi:methylenetetrahydrofolate dehydrogenase (NADP+)/methenyltetrahydrofolate cyclohydrolase